MILENFMPNTSTGTHVSVRKGNKTTKTHDLFRQTGGIYIDGFNYNTGQFDKNFLTSVKTALLNTLQTNSIGKSVVLGGHALSIVGYGVKNIATKYLDMANPEVSGAAKKFRMGW